MILTKLKNLLISKQPSNHSPPTPTTPPKPALPQTPFPLLSLPPEIRSLIYIHLLPPILHLQYTGTYAHPIHHRFTHLHIHPSPSLLLTNHQLHIEYSKPLYNTPLQLSSLESLYYPFPEWPLRSIVAPMAYPNMSGDRLSPEILRRFKSIRLTFLVGGFAAETEGDRFWTLMTRDGISGLKIILAALAISSPPQDSIDEESRNEDPEWREGTLYLDLEWPGDERVKRCTADEFEERWRKDGVWEELIKVERVRRIVFGGSAYVEFGRRWI